MEIRHATARREDLGTLLDAFAGMDVEPAFRRGVLARALTERAVAWARARGCASIRLTASADARALYEGPGFTNGRELVFKR